MGGMMGREPQYRRNRLTREWVVFAPGRAVRPHDAAEAAARRPLLPDYDPVCPFCPGNERYLAEIVFELPGSTPSGWQTRVVANKFPAVRFEAGQEAREEGLKLALPAYGRHEVFIETPRHDVKPAELGRVGTERLVEAYHRRYVELMADARNRHAVLFRNHGERAGISLLHPHSQIVVTGVVPDSVRRREEIARYWHEKHGICLLCAMAAEEEGEGTRIVAENEGFVAFVPYAAEVPFEVWIVPRRHRADFGDVDEVEKAALAQILADILARLHRTLGDPDYNYVFHTAAPVRGSAVQLHWYVAVRPRLTTRAGFEIGSGIFINPSWPEEDAAVLRDDAGGESLDSRRADRV